jgi:hypothetical protein
MTSLASTATPAAAGANVVDLQLVLAVDVSLSMNPIEQRIQRDGYIAAFKSPEVMRAITSGPMGRIAVTYIEWSGYRYQRIVVPWQVIGDEEEALLFADALERAPIGHDTRTSISVALLFAAKAFSTSGFNSERRTIDISGDGANNDGRSLTLVRDRVVEQGITINGLPILLAPTPTMGPLGPVSLQDYYEDCVIGGPTAFVVPVRSLEDFAPAIRRKLILEIVAVTPQVVPVLEQQLDRPKVDCLLAEAQDR